MALRVWLPLNGDLHNQGLSDIEAVNNGATVNNSGIIGKCYSFDGSSKYIYITNPLTDASEVSCAVWVKPLTNTSTYEEIINIGTAADWNNIRFGILQRSVNQFVFHVSDGTNTIGSSCASGTIPVNQWIHIACTYKDKTLKMYLNGELVKTYTISFTPSFAGITNIGIGAAPNGAEKFTGYINDIRIWENHCLSPLEIKKISRGLVLHYRLSGIGGENMIVNTNTMPVNTSSLKGFRASGGTVSHIDYDNLPVGNGVIRVTNTKTSTASIGMAQDSLSGFVTGEKYTESCWVRASTTVNMFLQPIWTSSSQTTGTSSQSISTGGLGKYFSVETDWQYISWAGLLKGDQATTYSSAYIYAPSMPANGWFEVCGMKVEHGDHPTPWCPNSSDDEYSIMGLDDNIEYDCSGYGNNGTRSEITCNSDTARYTGSYEFTSPSKITLPVINYSNFGNSWTFCAWLKTSKKDNMMPWGPSNGNRLNLYSSGGFLYNNTGDGSNNPFMKDGTNVASSAILDYKWHHIAVTGDGTSNKLYIDGELAGTAKIYKPLTATQYYLSGWLASNAYYYQGLMSDFRIYATALSEDDILDLYHLGGSIDSNGVFHTYEYVEGE